MEIRECVLCRQNKLTEIRRHLHRMPEYSFAEHDTSDYIFRYLQGLKPDRLERVANTGIRAVFMAEAPQKTVAVRADIDALPVEEKNECEYRSERAGMMHACGHDGHVAMALVTAELIASHRSGLKNNYVFLFQPAEETTGGALPMIQEGALKNPDVDEIYGIHLWPYLPFGRIGTRPGPLMANMCDLNIRINGRGSHGAKPQQGRDALVAAAHLIGAIQTIVSRSVDPYETAVITIGRIEGGETRNVICETVRMEGTIRTFSPEVAATVKRRLKEMMEGTDKAFGVTSESVETMSYPAVVNHAGLFDQMKSKLQENEWEETLPVMISEDFSNYQAAVPGLFAFLGTAITETAEPLHSNRFDFDETVLMHGVEYFLRMTDFEESI